MSSPFHDALAAGLAAVHALAGVPMLYHAGAAIIALPSVVVGQTRYEREDESGVVVTATATDLMFAVADLVHDGQPVEPTPGHWIEYQGQAYEVLPLGDEPCWRYSEPAQRSEYRVHTKERALQ